MGTSFFKNPKIGPSNQNMTARALGAGQYAARGASIGTQKDLAQALNIGKSKFKPNKASGAYPPGPKV